MPTNVYFNPGVLSEQRLYEDMIEESLRIYGQDVYYIPRVLKNLDSVTNDAIASEYNQAYLIEMYIDDSGYSGEGTIMSKFGLEIRDQSRLVVSRRRWENFIGRENTTMIGGRPNEGDLIYIPLSGSFHEIKFVEHEAAFYQLANIFVYELHCETWEYSGEKMNTGYPEIDGIENTYAAAQTVYIGSGNDKSFHPNEEVQQFVGYDTNNKQIFITGTIASANYEGGILASIQVNEIRSNSKGTSRYFQESGSGDAAFARRIIGMRSGAEYLISSAGSSLELPNDPNAQNSEFEDFGDTILDFSETNPFGEPSSDYAIAEDIIVQPHKIQLDGTMMRFDQNTITWDAQ
jgi:hypothetical protein